MLFEVIIGAITLIIEIIAKLILFLLKVLGLWIPMLYTLVFFILCAVFQVAFNEVLAIYFVGLAISLIITFYIMILRVIHRRKRRFLKKQKKRAKGKTRKSDKMDDEDESVDEKTSEDKSKATDEVLTVAPAEIKPEIKTEEEKKTEEGGYQPYINPANPTNENSVELQSYPPLQTNPTPPQYVPPQETTLSLTKPVIFRTRQDPNLLIYEYSDRLVYYRKTPNGLEHVKTERKNLEQ